MPPVHNATSLPGSSALNPPQTHNPSGSASASSGAASPANAHAALPLPPGQRLHGPRPMPAPASVQSGPRSPRPMPGTRTPRPLPPVPQATRAPRPLPQIPGTTVTPRPLPVPPGQVSAPRPLPALPGRSTARLGPRPLPPLPQATRSPRPLPPLPTAASSSSLRPDKSVPYMPVKAGRTLLENLNGQAGLGTILCRHLSFLYLFGGQSRQDFMHIASDLNNLEALTGGRRQEIEDQLNTLMKTQARHSPLVPAGQMGAWLNHTASNMQHNQIDKCRIFVSMFHLKHAVALHLELKPAHQGSGQRLCISAYDPNLTGNHHRVEFELPGERGKMAALSLEHLFPDLDTLPSANALDVNDTGFIPLSPDISWPSSASPAAYPLPASFENPHDMPNNLIVLGHLSAFDQFTRHLENQGISGPAASAWLPRPRVVRLIQERVLDEATKPASGADAQTLERVQAQFLQLLEGLNRLKLPSQTMQTLFNPSVALNNSGSPQPLFRQLCNAMPAGSPFIQAYTDALMASSLTQNDKFVILNS